MDGDALGGQRADVAPGDMFVIEGHDIARAGEPAQRVEVGGCTQFDVRGHERGPVVGALRQDPQRLTQCDGGLVGHPGELAAANHADDGQAGPGIHERRA